jgi:transposase-like protein
MFNIEPNINSIEQYILFVTKHGHKALRPAGCPYCGKADPWCHGSYARKADRVKRTTGSLNPVNIFRFFCKCCKRTCSVLPECIAPKRWYLWVIQQVALLLAINGYSRRFISTKLLPSRSTLRRWHNRFELMFKMHALHLCSRSPELGRRVASIPIFWTACLKKMSLARAMYWINHAGGIIP